MIKNSFSIRFFGFLFKLNDILKKKEKRKFALVIVFALIMALFQAASVLAILPFTRLAINPTEIHSDQYLRWLFNFFSFSEIEPFIVFMGLLVLIIILISNLVSLLTVWIKYKYIWQISHRISVTLLASYLSRPYPYFINKNTSELSKHILSEVQELTIGFLTNILSFFTGGSIVIVVFSILLYMDPWITIGSVGFLGFLYLIIFLLFSNKLRESGSELMESNRLRFKYATEALGGIKELKVLGAEKYFLDNFSLSSSKFTSLHSWYQIVYRSPRYILEIVAFGGIVAFMTYLMLVNFETTKIIPILSAIAFAGYRLMPALQEIFSSFSAFRFNKAILNRLHKDLVDFEGYNLNRKIRNKKNKLNLTKSIKLENLYFRYNNKEPYTLKNINIKILKNKSIAIVGATGAGKTTLLDLILGLIEPTKGKILIDDQLISKNKLRSWQNNIGYVPQQIFLSDDSVANNIAFGVNSPDRERVVRVAKIANIHKVIEALPEGYDTPIGERGVKMSGGQRQRIGIARALYHDPALIILDEATSALDINTEREVLSAIENISKLKTLIVVAHRLSTIKNCDQVIMINKGEVEFFEKYKDLNFENQKLAKLHLN